MYFDREKVKANARMVRIGMSDELADKMVGELESVIEWIKGLDDVDVEGIEPMSSVSEHPLPRRADTVRIENTREEILAGASNTDKNGECFAVPKIIE